ncbi:MAG: hypothetical protein ACOYI5_05230 [Christensenellales bacterium]|jgi:hypothetical protein
MRMMKYVCLILLFALLAAPATADVAIEVYAYDPCGGCGSIAGCKACTLIDEIANRYRLLFADQPIEIVIHNLRMDNAREAELHERLRALDIDPAALGLPVLFLGGAAFPAGGSADEAVRAYVDSGYAQYPGIEQLLEERAAYAESQAQGTVVYLTSAYCADCADVAKWLEHALPPGYTLAVYDIYTDAGMEMERHLRKTLDVPADAYCVPFIAYGEHWFAGKSSIYLSLLSRIQEHPGLSTTILTEE